MADSSSMSGGSGFHQTHYYLAWRALHLLARLSCRFTVEGRERVPREGGLIVAGNHLSYLDPPLLGLAVPRECHFLAKRELFAFPAFGALIRAYNAVPVERGTLDRHLLRRLAALLRGGGALLVFPEGTRSPTGQPGRARPGVGLIAREARVPVLPSFIEGTRGWWRRAPFTGRVRVRFGSPIPPPAPGAPREVTRAFGDEVMRQIGRLAAGPAQNIGRDNDK